MRNVGVIAIVGCLAAVAGVVGGGCANGNGGNTGGGGGGEGGGGGGGGASCTPMCGGRQCGDDGCGSSCGACGAAALCQAGVCTPVAGDALVVDAADGRHAIHPEVYGLAGASVATLKALNVPLNRWGGDSSTLYNWKLDVSNHAVWSYYENIPGGAAGSESADQFLANNAGAGAATLMTIPTVGWTPKDRVTSHPFTCGFPTEKYPNQQDHDQWDPHCGNGKDAQGKLLTPDPTNDSMAAPPSFEGDWVHDRLTGKVKFYQLDNEMMLWPSTHHDVRADPVSSDDVWKATTDYAPVIKANDAKAYVLGYTAWYALDLLVSGLDTANNSNADQKAHGSIPLAQWYLRQLKAWEQAHGSRLVDCLDFHYYPQGGDPLENTRSLWDATYHDPSWFNDFMNEPMQLLPRVQGWVAAEYPGTDVCVSEYNWNNGDPANPVAGLVEADVLGIFGKYGVRLAAFWTTPVDDNGNPRPAYRAFQLYRNADGAGHGFGDTSVTAASGRAKVAIYAAVDTATGALTVMVINKDTAPLTAPLQLANFDAAASAKVWQVVLDGAPTAQADLAVGGGTLALSLPARAMQLLVIPKK